MNSGGESGGTGAGSGPAGAGSDPAGAGGGPTGAVLLGAEGGGVARDAIGAGGACRLCRPPPDVRRGRSARRGSARLRALRRVVVASAAGSRRIGRFDACGLRGPCTRGVARSAARSSRGCAVTAATSAATAIEWTSSAHPRPRTLVPRRRRPCDQVPATGAAMAAQAAAASKTPAVRASLDECSASAPSGLAKMLTRAAPRASAPVSSILVVAAIAPERSDRRPWPPEPQPAAAQRRGLRAMPLTNTWR
jgi:hypothetical protein